MNAREAVEGPPTVSESCGISHRPLCGRMSDFGSLDADRQFTVGRKEARCPTWTWACAT